MDPTPGRTRPEVAVVGTANLDHTVGVARLPRPGGRVVSEILATAVGGKGVNQAVAAARQGRRVALIACVGDDPAGADVRAVLAAESTLDARGVATVGLPTGTAFVTVGADSANTAVSTPGANGACTADHVHRHGDAIASARVVLVQLGIPPEAVQAALDIARSVDTIVVLDPAPADEVTDDLLRGVAVCTPNETELERLTGIAPDDPEGVARATAALRARGCGAVVATLGARGAYVLGPAPPGRFVAPVPVAVVDPTGAGDAFAGVLAAGLAVGTPLDDAVGLAVVAGALATRRVGAVAALPTAAEIDAVARNR
ncbi:MAG: ribokinase [Actinomycetota bacterium]